MENKKSKNKVIITLLVIIVMLPVLFVILRKTHVILKIGDVYTWCFSTEFIVDEEDNINDDNISEIAYMHRLKHFTAMGTQITDFGFITDFPQLDSFSAVCNSKYPEIRAANIPSLKNSPAIDYVYVYVDVEDLDFIADLPELKDLTVVPRNTDINDISGLKNKTALKSLILGNVNCSDFSVLLDLPSLQCVVIEGTLLPDDIKNGLAENGVSIKNYAEDNICMIQGDFTKFFLPYDCPTPKSISLTNTTIDNGISKRDDKYTLYNSEFLSDLDTVTELSIYVDSIENVLGICEMDSLQTFRVNKGSISDEGKNLLKDKGIDVIEE
jgi:hypothetical protein